MTEQVIAAGLGLAGSVRAAVNDANALEDDLGVLAPLRCRSRTGKPNRKRSATLLAMS